MRASFFIAAGAAFVVTLAALTPFILGGAGLLPTKLIVARPPRFITDTFEFVLEPGWSCDLEDAEHVCTKGKPPNDVIAIIALKRRGPEDNLTAYENHLRDPNWGLPDSRILSVERRSLAGSEWIEGVRDSSEVRNYTTIYLATATSQVGVVATFSFHRNHEQAVRQDMDRMISTLEIHQQGL
jgi:hypothetical protein